MEKITENEINFIAKCYNKKDLVKLISDTLDREDIIDLNEDYMINSYRRDLTKIELVEVIVNYVGYQTYTEIVHCLEHPDSLD